MKKFLIVIMFLLAIFLLYKKSNDTFTIPNESIRFRIIANSNDFSDQLIKEKLRKHIEPIIDEMLKDTDNVDEARLNIKDNLDSLTIAIE